MKPLSILLVVSFLLLYGCMAPVTTLKKPIATDTDTIAAASVPPEDQSIDASVTLKPNPTYVNSDSCKVVIGQRVSFVFDYMSNTKAIYVACEIKNVGSNSVSIDNLKFYAVDKGNNTLLTMNARFMPDYINPGETAYGVADTYTLDNIDPNSIAKINIEGQYSPTNKQTFALNITGSTYVPPETEGTGYGINFTVENDSQKIATNNVAICAFYDEDNKFLGVVIQDLNNTINPGEKISDIGIYSDDFPFSMRKEVAAYKIFAYSYTG